MIRVRLTPRLIKSARKLGPEITAKAEAALTTVAAQLGSPHLHGGLGLRKIGRNAYEARVHLQWRIILILEPDSLMAYDIMNHDEVRAWLKKRK